MAPSTGRNYTTDAQSERATLHRGISMNKTFASLTAAVIVSLATSLAAAQASAVVLAPEVRARHVVTPNIAPVRVPVVHPRTRGGVTVIAPVRVPVVRARTRGVTVIRR
jgi:hypothetical protein